MAERKPLANVSGVVSELTSSDTIPLANVPSITLAKLQDIAQDKFLGRFSVGTGDVELLDISPISQELLTETTAVGWITTLGAQTAISGATISNVLPQLDDKILIQDTSNSDSLRYSTVAQTITNMLSTTTSGQVLLSDSGAFGSSAGLTFSNLTGLIGNDAGGTAIDLRWETDTLTHAFFVDASANKVFIGFNSAPSAVAGEVLGVSGSIEASGGFTSTAFDAGGSLGSGGINFYSGSDLASYGVGFSVQVGSDYIIGTPNYLNFGSTAGSTGFGMRNNGGRVEVKNSGKNWTPIYDEVYVLGSDIATLASGAFINLTGLVFTYEINSTYVIDLYAYISSAAATTGHAFAFDTSSAVTRQALHFTHQLATTGTVTGGGSIADNTASAVSSGVPDTSVWMCIGKGIIKTTTNTGTAQLRHGSEVAAVSTVFTGTTMIVRKVA